MTYGDDNVMGVSKNAEWFNHTAIQKVLADHGITYTMADKTSASVPFIHINDVSFLKRTWRYDEDMRLHLCPLEHDSIEKMLLIGVQSNALSPELQAVAVIESAVSEYFFYGKKVFLQKRRLLQDVVEECGLYHLIQPSTFPSYDTLVKRFLSYDVDLRWSPIPGPDNLEILCPSSKVELNGCNTHRCGDHNARCDESDQPHTVYLIPNQNTEEGTCGCTMSGVSPRIIETPGGVPVALPHDDGIVDSSLSMSESFDPQFEYQSDEAPEMGTTEATGVAEETAATMGFLEAPNKYTTGFHADLPPASYSDATTDDSLSEFLSRPVRIAQTTWAMSDVKGTSTTYHPWRLFFNDPAIQRKLQNYAWLKCDLKIKVMLNASPFYYGANLLHYVPIPDFVGQTVSLDAGFRYFIPFSQRPHMWIYPQNNSGGEMTLPFLYHKNWLSTVNGNEFNDMGLLISTIVDPLQSANGATGTDVTVSLYAWAENVVISGPTVGLVLQADEYGKGPVSSVASAVATAAQSLARIPLIRPYATATQMGASAISSVASKMGYCNTPVIADTMPIRPSAFPVMSTTEQGYPVEKLTVDPKNELSVDPKILGLPSIDELNISNLVQHESYLTMFPWSSTAVGDTLLFSTAILPTMFDMESTTNPKLYLTPMAWVSQMFQYWRGDIIIRLKFLCTQFHRGRVRVTYDPSGNSTQNLLNTAASQSSCFNEVIDLSKDTNVEIRIPYNQALAWCDVPIPTSSTQIPFTIGGGTAFNHVPGTTNGQISVRCVTRLTGPTATNSINCLVSVRGAENLEFAAPADIFARYSTFAPQSDEYDDTVSQQVITGGSPGGSDPHRYLVNHGEHVVSLRQLVRRMQYVRTFVANAGTNSQACYTDTFFKMPPYYGYDAEGLHQAKGLITPATDQV